MRNKQTLIIETNFNNGGESRTRRIFSIFLASLILAGLYFGLVSPAQAEETCEKLRPLPTIVKQRVTYLGTVQQHQFNRPSHKRA